MLPLLFLLALLPRLTLSVDFLTVDEAYHWFTRVTRFQAALRSGDAAATLLSGHPGVTTLWLGWGGLELHNFLMRFASIHADPALQRTVQRAPLALVAALGVVLAYPLLVRLLGKPVALLATLFWATSPFLVAHAQLLHLDSLLTTFMSLTLLTALVALRFDQNLPAATGPPRWRLLLASGACAGLALLTKSPALLLGPACALLALTAAWRNRSLRSSLLIGAGGLLWGVAALLVIVVLWPALRADPALAIGRYLAEIRDNGGTAHGWGNFFAGQTAADPGPLFYPTAVALRVAPWVLPGLLLAVLLLPFEPERRRRTVVLLLAACVLGCFAALSFPAKKFDRYALPAFPALAIIAAYGWGSLFTRLLAGRHAGVQRRVASLAWAAALVAAVGLLFSYRTYPLAYYNPLLGGGPTAARLIPVGWGEGLEAAGAFITAQPDGCSRPIATWYRAVLDPFVCHRVVPLDDVVDPQAAGYAVLYIDQIQRGNDAEFTRLVMERGVPMHTIRIHGIDYAYIYHLPPPIEHPTAVAFGPAVRLTGYAFDTTPLASDGYLQATLQWRIDAPVAAELMLFIHLFDAAGNRIGQADVPLGGPENPVQQWAPGHYAMMQQRVPLFDTAATPAWVALGVYTPDDFARLPLNALPPPAAPASGPDAFVVRLGSR